MRIAPSLQLTAPERQQLTQWARGRQTPVRLVLRAKIALLAAEGSLLSTCLPRHRHQEWLRFMRLIDRHIPQGKALYLIADNYATHKHPTVQ
jgi:hypothetical protein